MTFEIKSKAGEKGKLFGSVTASEIAAIVQKSGLIVLDKKKIRLAEPIHSTGDFSVPIKLHPEVEANILVRVVAG